MGSQFGKNQRRIFTNGLVIIAFRTVDDQVILCLHFFFDSSCDLFFARIQDEVFFSIVRKLLEDKKKK